MTTGTLGMALVDEEIGRFNRTLPPQTVVQYDPRWELGLEVMRWFHYRYDINVGHQVIDSVDTLRKVMLDHGYSRWYAGHGLPKKMWAHLVPVIIEPRINEFIEVFKDVLAEIEILRPA